ncbi:MAG TPA: hypothetical protein VFE88_04260 [Candidatus Nanoarchaeia archaeon]|nr:hypothetical protein [Candidatus Nanoarchaeia archaeon]
MITKKQREAAWKRIESRGKWIKKNWYKSGYERLSSVEIVKKIRRELTVPRQKL